MDLKNELTAIVDQWNLLKHPFYQAWTAGNLSVEDLQVYASEYGAFIETLPQAWLTLNDSETAQEEIEHIEYWDVFTNELGGKKAAPQFNETLTLVQTAHKLFSQPATALGALYAFEVQQPDTAKSKLDGLNQWYKINEGGKKYFEIHSTNWHESNSILDRINSLPLEEQKAALEACAFMGQALWDGLTGIHKGTCGN